MDDLPVAPIAWSPNEDGQWLGYIAWGFCRSQLRDTVLVFGKDAPA